MRRFVSGRAVLKTEGDRPERLLAAAAQAGIVFWDASAPQEMSLTLCVRGRDAPRVEALAQRMGLDCRTVSESTPSRLGRVLRRRKALIAALGACLLTLTVSRAFIWRVEIADTAGLSESVVRETLRECGVDVGRRWLGLSQDLTRNALLRRLPELRWATVNIRGGTAEILLRPAREKPPIENEGECADIVAVRGGYITQVRALRGAAVVKPGQTVLAGDVLISGEAVGRYESHGAARAIGTVQARTWYEMTAAAPLEECKTEQGPCICTRWALIFGKRRINFYKGCSICPPGCAKMTEETQAAVKGLFSLPLRIVREKLYKTETSTQPESGAAERMQRQLTEKLRAVLPDDGEIEQLRFTQSESGGWLYVTMHAECREPIGVTVPMTAGQIAAKTPQTKEEDP